MEWSRNRDLVESLDAQLRARPVDAEPPTIDFVQGLVRSIVSDATHPLHAKHPSLQDMREEDSPGNYIIREGAGPFGVEFVTYDPTGEENPWRLGER